MLLAVLSYPKNYHITQVAVKHALKHIPNITQVAIIWDDTHDTEPSIPLHQVIDKAIMYKWSSLLNIISFDYNNWIGQQLIKLHADLILPKDEFILFDGDLIINQNIDPVNIMYSNNLPRSHPRYDHVAELLGLGVYDFSTNPFMYYKSQWLKNVRDLCEKNSHSKIDKKLTEAFKDAQSAKHLNYLLEWNIMARYVLQVLKLPKKVEYFHRRLIKANNFYNAYNNEENFVVDGADNIDLRFYENEGIFIDKALMSKLGY
jgi:hypothetical protein